jgi:hypothetical protein
MKAPLQKINESAHLTPESTHTCFNFTGFDSEQILAYSDGVLLCRQKLNNFTRRRCVHRNVNLEISKPVYWGKNRGLRTLSVSIVAISSSAATLSPTCFNHDFNVPSVMDSAICGTFTVSATTPNRVNLLHFSKEYYSAPCRRHVEWNVALFACTLAVVLEQNSC